MSFDEKMNYNAIICEGIPALFLDKIVAKQHFSKFGKIKRFILRPKRLTCTVEYENKEDAQNAYFNARNFNGVYFNVSFAERVVAHVQNTEEWVDPDVQAELEAMSPSHRLKTSLRNTALQKSNLMNRVVQNSNNFSITPTFLKTASRNEQKLQQAPLPKIDDMFRSEIESILKTTALTDEEKYRVLDARDKLIRLTTVQQTDIKKAVATKGTCPDMCPEKERLMREFQRQVSIFEMTDDESSESKICHKKAIKEYSRSSADQEVPLSHELRSEPVLQMTMLYLVHRIMGLCDDPKTSLCEWFHFVWDRTRSIRKDITQQELCSLGAVQLVEQCARFHIHCAARLVAEDPSVFDKKINAENLTKCLQTLKYMYHDLRIKGIECPCEAEFRSYIILLNLGDSNFLWEVKQLPELIQKSDEIKRAIGFYNAIQNNNFVKFFSMIKSPNLSYLSACILLGYFTKLRVRAMHAIIKSHNWRKNDIYLPLSYLTTILGFDNETSAASFFSQYGLHCDLINKRVLLDHIAKPNSEYVMTRAVEVVESKRHVSVGECVFGQPLPPATIFEQHQPHNSFDNNGLLKVEALAFENSISKSNIYGKPQPKCNADTNLSLKNENRLFKLPQPLKFFSTKPQRNQEEESKKENATDTFSTKTDAKIRTPITLNFPEKTAVQGSKNESASNSSKLTIYEHTTEKKLRLGNALTVTPNIENNNHIFLCKTVGEKARTLQEEKLGGDSENEKLFLERRTGIKKYEFPIELKQSVSFASEGNFEYNNPFKKEIDKNTIVKNFLNKKSKHVNNSNLNRIQEQKEFHKKNKDSLKIIIEEKSQKITELFVSKTIEEEILKLIQVELLTLSITSVADEQNEILITDAVNVFVEEIANEEYAVMCYEKWLLCRYFRKWLLYLHKKREQRKLIEDTPLWIAADKRAEYTQSIKHPCEQKNVRMVTRYRLGQPLNFDTFLKMDCTDNEHPLNLFALVGQHFLSKRTFNSYGLLQQRKYFKFIITLPEDKEELHGFESLSNKWLIKLIENCKPKTVPFLRGIEHNIALCVRKLNGIIPKNEEGCVMTTETDHNDGVLCFITGIEIDTHSRTRLQNLLKLTKNLKRIPLAIIAYNCSSSEEELAELLGLTLLQEKGLIHSYLILGCELKKRCFSFRELVTKAVNFIARESDLLNSNEIQALATQNGLCFLEASLGEEMWQKWFRSAKRNPIFNKMLCLPEHAVGIFNKALDHLLHITQEDFDDMPEFPEELKEFVPDYVSSNIPLGLEYFPTNWKTKTDKGLIKQFLQSLYMPDVEGTDAVGIEDLKLWLQNYTRSCMKGDEYLTAKAFQESLTILFTQINSQGFDNIEVPIRTCLINYLHVFKPIICTNMHKMFKHFITKLTNLKVIYLKDDLENYQKHPWWLNCGPFKSITIDYNENALSFPQSKQQNKANWVSDDELNRIVAKAAETSCTAEENIRKLKRKHFLCSNSSTDLSITAYFKRTLDDSLYQFELCKNVGQYETSFVTNLTQAIDKSISKILSHPQKRKLSPLKSQDNISDIGIIISRATKLIHKVESKRCKMNITKSL